MSLTSSSSLVREPDKSSVQARDLRLSLDEPFKYSYVAISSHRPTFVIFSTISYIKRPPKIKAATLATLIVVQSMLFATYPLLVLLLVDDAVDEVPVAVPVVVLPVPVPVPVPEVELGAEEAALMAPPWMAAGDTLFATPLAALI